MRIIPAYEGSILPGHVSSMFPVHVEKMFLQKPDFLLICRKITSTSSHCAESLLHMLETLWKHLPTCVGYITATLAKAYTIY